MEKWKKKLLKKRRQEWEVNKNTMDCLSYKESIRLRNKREKSEKKRFLRKKKRGWQKRIDKFITILHIIYTFYLPHYYHRLIWSQKSLHHLCTYSCSSGNLGYLFMQDISYIRLTAVIWQQLTQLIFFCLLYTKGKVPFLNILKSDHHLAYFLTSTLSKRDKSWWGLLIQGLQNETDSNLFACRCIGIQLNLKRAPFLLL